MVQRNNPASIPQPLQLEVSRSALNKGGRIPPKIAELVRELLAKAGLRSGNYSFHIFSSLRHFRNQFEESVSIAPDKGAFRLTVTTGHIEYTGIFKVGETCVDGLNSRLAEAAKAVTSTYARLCAPSISHPVEKATNGASVTLLKYSPGNAIQQEEQVKAASTLSIWFDHVCKLQDLERKFNEFKAHYKASMGQEEGLPLLEDIPLLIIAHSLRNIKAEIRVLSETLTKAEELKLIKLSLLPAK